MGLGIKMGGGGNARIEKGSYVGTGTYGENNPNTLTFNFKPKVVMIHGNKGLVHVTVMMYGETVVPAWASADDGGKIWLTWDKKSVTWYNKGTWNSQGGSVTNAQSATYQLNESNVTYDYIAIG